jgi:nickel-dependent lactate racemase
MMDKTIELVGAGFSDRFLTELEAREILNQAFADRDLDGQRVLVIIPDGTRTAPIPMFFRLLYGILSQRVAALDVLVALGTHPPMSEAALNQLVGVSPAEWGTRYPKTMIFNHRWDLEDTFTEIGTIDEEESTRLSRGMLSLEVPVLMNRKVLDYDLLLVCGPVFPHEVVGFSGGSKYFSPGISGAEIINFTHWLGALITSYEIIGTKATPVRDVIERVAEMIPRPKLCICMVVKTEGLSGLFVGESRQAWSAAADLSAQLHIKYLDRPYRQVLSVMPGMYDDLWTGAKGMYKLEPVVADGGELIIYAPHITEISYTHGAIIDKIGYHVRDYFVGQWEQFRHYPWGVLAHSTHLRGIGTYHDGIEEPRIRVTLATGIPEERCRQVNLGYRDPATIDPDAMQTCTDGSLLVVPHAGEVLYRLKDHVHD